MPISTPNQITVPFATSGLKNAIPAAANPVTGNAGYDAGFPATNMTPKEAGGIPPFGQDFNGILFDITTALQFIEAGGVFPYSSSFATTAGGFARNRESASGIIHNRPLSLVGREYHVQVRRERTGDQDYISCRLHGR